MPADVGPSRKHLSTLCSWEQTPAPGLTLSGEEGRSKNKTSVCVCVLWMCVCVCVYVCVCVEGVRSCLGVSSPCRELHSRQEETGRTVKPTAGTSGFSQRMSKFILFLSSLVWDHKRSYFFFLLRVYSMHLSKHQVSQASQW